MNEEITTETVEEVKNRIINFEKNNETSFEKKSSTLLAENIVREIEKVIRK